jgi:hypothetical protein
MPLRPAIAGIVCASLAAWLACPAAPRRPYTIGGVVLFSILYTLIVAAAGATGARLASSGRVHWKVAAITAWIAPLSIFWIQRSLIAALVSAILAGAFFLERTFRPAAIRFGVRRQFGRSFVTAVLLQFTAMAVLGEQVRASVVLAAITAAALCWSSSGILNRRRIPAAAGIALALILTVAALTEYLPPNFGNASAGVTAPGRGQETAKAAGAAGIDEGGDYAGVILIPEEEPHVRIVPPLPLLPSDIFKSERSEPLSIPFYGAYWFYRPPQHRPPANSVIMRGTPETRILRSVSGVTLEMEAHQNLGKLFNTSCCSRLEMVIRNSETLADSTGIEVSLINTTAPGTPFQYLGAQIADRSARQSLRYAIPASPVIEQFDELAVRFKRSLRMRTQSTRIAIEKFVLVPRGSR